MKLLKHSQKSRDENISITRWEHSDTDIGLKRRLEMRGKAEFNDDYTDIRDATRKHKRHKSF